MFSLRKFFDKFGRKSRHGDEHVVHSDPETAVEPGHFYAHRLERAPGGRPGPQFFHSDSETVVEPGHLRAHRLERAPGGQPGPQRARDTAPALNPRPVTRIGSYSARESLMAPPVPPLGQVDPELLANVRRDSSTSGEDEYGLPVSRNLSGAGARKKGAPGEEPRTLTRCDQCASILTHASRVQTIRCGACGKIMDLVPRPDLTEEDFPMRHRHDGPPRNDHPQDALKKKSSRLDSVPNVLSADTARGMLYDCMKSYLLSITGDAKDDGVKNDDSSKEPVSPCREEREIQMKARIARLRTAFGPFELHLRSIYGKFASLNSAFSNAPLSASRRTRSEGSAVPPPLYNRPRGSSAWDITEVNGKTLLVGDVAENAALWMGANGEEEGTLVKARPAQAKLPGKPYVSRRSPYIDWAALHQWYEAVIQFDEAWRDAIFVGRGWKEQEPSARTTTIDAAVSDYVTGQATRAKVFWDLTCARTHVHRLLLKITEKLLKRPGLLLQEPQHLRFLLIIISNPLLCSHEPQTAHKQPLKHTSIIRAAFGQLVNCAATARKYLPQWFAGFSEAQASRLYVFQRNFFHHRLGRLESRRPREGRVVRPDGSSVGAPPHGPPSTSPASLWQAGASARNVVLPDGTPSPSRGRDGEARALELDYLGDWQLAAASALGSILFASNNLRAPSSRRPCYFFYDLAIDSFGTSALLEDFRSWEASKAKFTFCSFPFLLSMSAKLCILQYDANRQQTDQARKAWFEQFTSNHVVSSNLNLHVRRDCLAADALKEIKAVASTDTSRNDLRKALRIYFAGEDGIDAGGLRKEFFLLLMRELLDQQHGLVEYDEDSNYCYFNPHTLEDSEQYFLLGTLVGLAIYNSTIVDLPFPPFLFKKLLDSSPSSRWAPDAPLRYERQGTLTLDDLAQFRPGLARGLQQLLEFDGDVESVFCRTFAVDVDRYGKTESFPLIPNYPECMDKPVTNANRSEFVALYINFLLNESVSRQFEPFKRGFFSVAGGNSLSLLQPEELELLVRGSAEALDVDALRAVAVYQNWKDLPDRSPAITWFWQFFKGLGVKEQRSLLGFITGSDRVPALGETSLIIKIQCAGDEQDRLPWARTCFNQLCIYNYRHQPTLQRKLWQAVTESAGFLLK